MLLWLILVSGTGEFMALQVGTSVGLAVSTTIHNRVTFQAAEALGFTSYATKAYQVPNEALLSGYRAAQYTSFGFAMVGKCYHHLDSLLCSFAPLQASWLP